MRSVPCGVAAGVFEQRRLLRVDTGQQIIVHRIKGIHGLDRVAIPDIGGRGGEIGGNGRWRRDPFQRLRDAAESFLVHRPGLIPLPRPGKPRGPVILLS